MRGLAGTPREHRAKYAMLLDRVEGHLDSAERIIRGGECRSAVNSAVAAFQEYGEMQAHRTQLGATRLEKRFRAAGVRLNHLRHAIERCMG